MSLNELRRIRFEKSFEFKGRENFGGWRHFNGNIVTFLLAGVTTSGWDKIGAAWTTKWPVAISYRQKRWRELFASLLTGVGISFNSIFSSWLQENLNYRVSSRGTDNFSITFSLKNMRPGFWKNATGTLSERLNKKMEQSHESWGTFV